MRIAVIGAGGVGGYFGGRLAANGTDVVFVARGAHLQAIQRNGLRIESPLGNALIEPAHVVDDIARIDAVDLAIVAVKLWDTESVAAAIRPLAETGAAVVSFQNGVSKDEVLRKYLPASSIIGGVAYIAAVIAEPGVVRHTGQMQRLAFGEYDGSHSARVQALQEACAAANIDAVASDAIERLIWEKYVFLVAMSAVTSTMRQPLGPIRENPHTRAFLGDLMREVAAVGRAHGIALRDGFVEERLAFCDTLPASMTSSMSHDLSRGGRLELPWLSGGIVELGERVGVAAPLNRAVRDILMLYAEGRIRA
jgi:2-dehydropantoate 2-reductase